MSPVTPQPTKRPTNASTAASHTDTVSSVLTIGKLFSFVKMYGCSWEGKKHTQTKWSHFLHCTIFNFKHITFSGPQASGDVRDVFHYLRGAPDVVSVVCERVVRLFLPHWLQLGTKQRTALASRSLVKQARAKPLVSPHSPCYSTELRPWKYVPAGWNGNSPLRRRWCRGRHPGKKVLVRVCAPGSVAIELYEEQRSEALTAFSGMMVFWKKGCTTAAKSFLPS